MTLSLPTPQFGARLTHRKDMPRKIDKLLARRVSRHLGKFHFGFRHPLPYRSLFSYFGSQAFPDQLLVGQPAPEDRTCGFHESICVAAFALVVAKCLFIQIAEEM